MVRFVALRVAALVAGVAFLSAPAMAQTDYWSGFYAGAQGGALQGSFVATGSLSIGNSTASASKNYSDKSFEGGVLAGYRWQSAQGIVLGGEADFNWTDLSAKSAPLLSVGLCPWLACANLGQVQTDVDWYGTARLVAGQSFGQLFLYGTGGLAYGNVSSTISSSVTVLGSTATASDNHAGVRYGWTAGAGAAIAINERVSVKLEYLHVNLGDEEIFNWSGKVFGKQVTKSVIDEVALDSVRVGIQVRFP